MYLFQIGEGKGSKSRGIDFAFHMLCSRNSGSTKPPTAQTAIRLWETTLRMKNNNTVPERAILQQWTYRYIFAHSVTKFRIDFDVDKCALRSDTQRNHQSICFIFCFINSQTFCSCVYRVMIQPIYHMYCFQHPFLQVHVTPFPVGI